MRRGLIVLAGGVVGVSVGALVAVVGATEVFACRDNPPVISGACAGGSEILALMWGAPIGLVVGTVLGWMVSRRLVRSA